MKNKVISMLDKATVNGGMVTLTQAVHVLSIALSKSQVEVATTLEELRLEGLLTIASENCACHNPNHRFYQEHGYCEWCTFMGDREDDIMYVNVVQQYNEEECV